MQIGKLNKRVQLQAVSSSQNGKGEPINVYTTYATVWAQIQPMSGLEKGQADQVSVQVIHKIVIRYNSSVCETDRIIHNGRIFEINAIINPFEKNQRLELMCVEVR